MADLPDTGEEVHAPEQAPKKKKKGVLFAIIAALVVVLIILAAVFVFFPAHGASVVGIWHITKAECCGNTSVSDEYFAFYENGTFLSLDNTSGQKTLANWKYVEDTKVEISEGSIQITYAYDVSGNNIKLSAEIQGQQITLYGVKVRELPAHTLYKWDIMINGKDSKSIYATTRSDGVAVWNGEVMVFVESFGDYAFANANVTLRGCGINYSGVTDSTGSVDFYLIGVMLPAGRDSGEINVTIDYKGLVRYDTISVIRSAGAKIEWTVKINDTATRVFHAYPLDGGTARWNGNITILVSDYSGSPLTGVNVSLYGCGLDTSGLTDANGTVMWVHLQLTLANGVVSEKIAVIITYNGTSMYDYLTVIRS